jgi:hypothetical protein
LWCVFVPATFALAGAAGERPAKLPLLPLAFEQAEAGGKSQAMFTARGRGYGITVRAGAVTLGLAGPAEAGKPGANVDGVLRLLGVNESAAGTLLGPTGAVTNYFIGNDPKRWRTGVATYRKVRFREVYPGIDIVYYGNNDHLEYDLEAAPGADLSPVRMAFEGLGTPRLDPNGDLLLQTSAGPPTLKRPLSHQVVDGAKREAQVRYRLLEDNRAGFESAGHDPARPLVVDPVIVFSAAIGGSGTDFSIHGSLMTQDASGNIYILGRDIACVFAVPHPDQPCRKCARLNRRLVWRSTLHPAAGDRLLHVAVQRTLPGGGSELLAEHIWEFHATPAAGLRCHPRPLGGSCAFSRGHGER